MQGETKRILFFDLESDGLLDTMTKIHCLVISDGPKSTSYTPKNIEEGVKRIQQAIYDGVSICGHNIIQFDIPAIQLIFPWFDIPRDKRHLVIDTLVLSRLCFSDIKDRDAGLLRSGRLSGSLFGSHGLKAWGYRLGELKGTYAEDTWACFTEEMLEYCVQDVVVTERLYDKLMSKLPTESSVSLEHQAQWLMKQIQDNGFPFDTKKATDLEAKLRKRSKEIRELLWYEIPYHPVKEFTPKVNSKKQGYAKGCPLTRLEFFNPNSRQQIEWLLRERYGYNPSEEDLYENDRLKIDETTFNFIKKDEEKAPTKVRKIAEIFEESLLVSKRLGQLADGKHAWLKCVKDDGAIHGSINPNGAVTGRATHASPNVAQVPASGSPFGHECRELFGVPEGWIQVGVDAAGLELRCLGHFMAPYDGGVYADTVVHGDIHTLNQEAAGLPTRDNAKTFIYGFLYGAGDAKIGQIVKGDAKRGKQLKRSFLKKTPAIAQLKKAIDNALVAESMHGRPKRWKRKFLKGLDGRPLHVRSLHSALNLLLQSAGALICKLWIIRFEERMVAKGYKHGWTGDFAMMAWVHDEFQAACRTEEIAKIVAEEAQAAMRDTQEFFTFRVQLDTEAKVGKNWAECH